MTQPGDLYELGDHRLICGDATDPAVLARLMGDDKADLWLTDPPYGVDYDAPALQRPGLRDKFRREKLTNDAGDLSFFPAVVDNVDANLKEGGVFYVWYSIVTSNHFIETLKNKFYLSIALIWDKTRITPSYGDYCHNYEPCLYGWKKGAEHYFKGETGEPALWRFNKNLKNKLHPTEKPVDLFIKSIKLSSRRGEIVLDTFAGSGTTLIAAEQTGRRARCVELSGAYCDVILKRWMDFTGEEPVKL